MRARIDAVGESLGARHLEWVDRFGSVAVVSQIVGRSLSDGGTMIAGLLAYRLFVLILPIGAVVVALAGFDQVAASDTADSLGLGKWIASTIARAGEDSERSRFPLLVTGLVGFAIASWGLLGSLQFAAATAWRIPTKRFPRKGRAVIRLAGSVAVFLGVLYLSLLVRRAGLFAGLAATGANFLAALVAFFGLSWILPHRCREWFWLVPGAFVGALGVLGMQLVAMYYLPLKLSSSSQTYGTLGTVLAVLTYLYLFGFLMWLVVLVDVVLWDHHRHEPPGNLRRIAGIVPIPTTRFASGHVSDSGTAATVGGPQRPGTG